MKVSVIIPTYNPDLNRLNQTLDGLKGQTLAVNLWELIIVDNNSTNSFDSLIDTSWHPNSVIVKELIQGLTYARLKGFNHAKAEIIIMVDDDNILDKNYLEQALNILNTDEGLGAIGGKSLPLFECPPPQWLSEFYGSLALRNLGDEIIINKCENTYPAAAPIGAGMVIRKTALQSYINAITTSGAVITDRTAKSLSSGGDNEIVIEILKTGWQVGYFPALVLQHIIPGERMQVNYLARLLHDTNKSWAQLLTKHNINPWKNINLSTITLRKIKAYLSYKAWKSDANYIKWQAACGLFEGLAK